MWSRDKLYRHRAADLACETDRYDWRFLGSGLRLLLQNLGIGTRISLLGLESPVAVPLVTNPAGRKQAMRKAEHLTGGTDKGPY